jgi:hypothetical protein
VNVVPACRQGQRRGVHLFVSRRETTTMWRLFPFLWKKAGHKASETIQLGPVLVRGFEAAMT